MTERPERQRRYLGRGQSLSERVRTYWTDDALEIDQTDHYEIRRRRVFFDEILLVTLHATRGLALALLPLILALLLAVFAVIPNSEPDVSRGFWIGAALFAGLAAGLAFVPVWVVTVYGKRTRARMHFRMRQAKAREIYADICRAASDAQRAAGIRLAAEAPAEPPPLPPPPLPLSDSELPPPPEEPSASS